MSCMGYAFLHQSVGRRFDSFQGENVFFFRGQFAEVLDAD